MFQGLIGRPLSSMAVISWFSENNAANFSENKNWYYMVLPKNPSWTPGLGPMAFLSPFLFAVVVVVFLNFFVTPSPPLPTHFCVFLLLKPSRQICSPGSLGYVFFHWTVVNLPWLPSWRKLSFPVLNANNCLCPAPLSSLNLVRLAFAQVWYPLLKQQ